MAQAQERIDEPGIHCVTRRCRLCRFPIEMGEMIVADVNGWLTPAYALKESAHYYEDKHMLLQGCRVECIHEDGESGQVPCYHVECRKYASWPEDQYLLRATEYTYEPTMREDQRRINRTWLLLGRRLQQVYEKLPAEVCYMIAGELVHEVAAMATDQLWKCRPQELENTDIYNRIDMKVRARYIYIDGIRYVESLSSSPYAEGELVVDPATSSTIDAIHVLEDHIGVRQVLFSSTEHSQKLEALLSTPVKDAWWRSIPFSTTVFYANFDGVKLRSIKTDGRGPRPVPSAAMQGKSTSADVAWPRPMYPANEPVLNYSNFNNWEIEEERRNAEITPWTPFTRYRFRTVSLDFNDTAVTGYSVCFMSGIRGIYAHRGEDMDMYNDVDMYSRKGNWTYMPIDPDERISAIWIRSQDTTSSTGLIFQTNKGRQVMFGVRTDSQSRLDRARLWTPLLGVSENPFRVYCKHSYRGVDQIAVQPLETLTEEPPREMMPWPTLPSPAPRTQHFSAVSLDNVMQITPCGREIAFQHEDLWVITGIMVHYADGHRACAGEFRLDCAGESMRVDNMSMLMMGFYVTKDKTAPWLGAIESEPTDDEDFLTWKSLRCGGMLEWWFDEAGRCQIFRRDPTGQLSRV